MKSNELKKGKVRRFQLYISCIFYTNIFFSSSNK